MEYTLTYWVVVLAAGIASYLGGRLIFGAFESERDREDR